MTVTDQIEDRIGTYDAAMANAKSEWNAPAVRINSYMGGVDPTQVLSALEQIDRRGTRWKQRGRALAYGRPLVFDSGKTDTLSDWVEMGNLLLHETASTAQDANESKITTVVEDTISATGTDIVEIAEKAKAQLAWWGPFMIPALIVGGIGLVLFQAWTWIRAVRRPA